MREDGSSAARGFAKRLERYMLDAWRETSLICREQNVRLRMAAHMLAVRRVAQADRLRGVYA